MTLKGPMGKPRTVCVPQVLACCRKGPAAGPGRLTSSYSELRLIIAYAGRADKSYSTVTLFARLRGLSTSHPLALAV